MRYTRPTLVETKEQVLLCDSEHLQEKMQGTHGAVETAMNLEFTRFGGVLQWSD